MIVTCDEVPPAPMKKRPDRRHFEQQREDCMKKHNRMTRGWGLWVATAVGAIALTGVPAGVSAQLMTNYTNNPIFLSQTVSPNILFLVDMGNFTLEAAYSGTNHQYPISFKTATATAGQYASNVTVDSQTGSDLVAVNNSGVSINTSNVTSPADTFDSTKSYYGMFDPLRCYTTDSNSFNYGSVKAALSTACANNHWDGNFLNWLTQRKKEMIYQVLIGGKPIPANANADGTANNLNGEPKTGENGSTASCSNNSNSCWRYVKFVPAATLTGRVPTTLPTSNVNLSAGGPILSTAGRIFGVGDGQLYVNDDTTADPFNTANSNKYSLEADLTTEPNSPAGSGTQTVCMQDDSYNTINNDPNFMGHLACYKKERSLGLFQKMRVDNMHVGIMMVNAETGQGASMKFSYDEAFNSSDVTGIRNEQIQANSPIAEALYEGLCLFRKSQGPCYSNSGSWSTGYSSGGLGAVGDPFYFASLNQLVRCAKCFVLMISPGHGVLDGNAPDLQSPFGNLFTGANIGVVSSGAAGDRLDDVAYYGRRNDLRSDLAGTQNVRFYSVNAMGDPTGAALLASASKYGGFEDRNNDNAVDLTGSQTCTYPAGSRLGSGASTSNAEWDLDQDCVPDTFFDASEGGDLEAQINKAIADILKKAASGTSISVLASSSTGEGALFQAFFYPSTYEGLNEIKWSGFVQGLFVDPFGNLREDRGTGGAGAADGKLVYEDDNIVVTRTDPTSGDVVVDRYRDVSPVDGQADSTTPYETISLREMQGIWEAGKKLALRNITSSPRNLLTWIDLDNDGVVDSGEQMAFSTANAGTLAPYLRAASSGTFTASNIINFIHGTQVSGMRNREVTVDGTLHVWKLGDVVNSTPTIVGAPKERFDILYGDSGYRNFVRRWANRRQMAYVGANDGLLHAFNVGYYHRGDDPSTTSVQEHGWYTTSPSGSGGVGLGEEVWGFVPYHLLPQIRWYAQTDYTHVSYVDLKPKVTDIHIFTEEAACGGGTTPTAAGCIHPDGWGTILIAGLRFGGSCGSCAAVSGGNAGGPTLTVVADFNGNGNTTDVNDTRSFYSGYVVLDITDPEASPTVIGVYSSSDLGLTTSYPTVARMNLSSDGNTTHTNAKWYMVFGSGVHGYDGRAAVAAKIFAVELGTPLGTAPAVRKMAAGTASTGAFMGDPITLDQDLDFRSDAIYVGRTIDPSRDDGSGSPVGYWTGKMYRLTMGACTAAPCSTSTWGIASGANRVPTEMLDWFNLNVGWDYLGPVTSSPTVTRDDAGETWVFFGTGRFLSAADKADTSRQYLVGLKDSVMGSAACVQVDFGNCWSFNLLDVSNVQICVTCAAGSNQVNGISGTTTYPALISLVKSMDGWVTTVSTSGERSIVPPTIIAGAVLFPTFIPTTDICVASGNSNLWALFYKTGGAYSEPIMGVDASGYSKKNVSLGAGLASSVAIQIGAAPTGVAGFYQTSGANIGKITPKTPLSAWSEYISWISRRD
jgi:type IV pilus assembly protein PilY1